MVMIELTPSELHHAAMVGSTRQFEAATRGRRNAHGMSDDAWRGLANHICGACGEIAVAKALGIYWGGETNTFAAPDLADGIQVRTRREHYMDLIVREGDHNQHRFYLVTGIAPRLVVHGWIKGLDAKRKEWLRTYGNREPAYFVPKRAMISGKD